jgi:ribosome-binding ATPase YchF (GTP1/OBG family)
LKIGFTGLELPEGKIRYNDTTLNALSMKDKPKKVSPFYVDFLLDEFDKCDVIVIAKNAILDLLIHDMEKIETRMARLTNADETALLQRCLDKLEMEVPLCDLQLTDQEISVVKMAAPFSLKPVIQIEGNEDIDEIITLALDRAGLMFFYTSGPRESHAWLVERHSNIVSCAARIHSDLARGFIKGDVVSFEEYMRCHSFNEAKAKGLARLTDRDYIVQPREIIEIRYNVAH